MKAITQFEEFLEGLVEGSFRRLFGGRLEPVDLARRLGRVMDDNKRVTWDRPLVPNHYQITLSDADYALIQGFAESLGTELEKFADERAAERAYTMPAPAAVTLSADGGLQTGTFQVRATLLDAQVRGATGQSEPSSPRGPAAGQGVGSSRVSRDDLTSAPEPANVQPEDFSQTRAMRPLEMPLGPTGFETLHLAGEVAGVQMTWSLNGAKVRIGRDLDNDIVLDDASVSRHHAELSREGGRIAIRDLGSRNGTWVNAARVSVAAVNAGDEVALGAVQLEVTRRAPN